MPVIDGTTDMAVSTPADLSMPPPPPPPDLASLCPYGQSMQAGACSCDSDHPQACGASFCCASGQRCLPGMTARCSGPTGRQRVAMAFDPRRGVSVLRGGQCDDGMTGTDVLCPDQWQLNPTTFHPLGGLTGPSARSGANLAFDGTNLVLFGGQERLLDVNSMSNQTWVWNGTAWTQKMPAQSPPARANAGIAYDTLRKRVVLFGGVGNGDMALNDTWEWDGAAWTPRTLVNSPSEREGHGMAYDQKHSRVVVFGGLAGGIYASDTWIYDGITWTPGPFVPGMPQRAYFGMAYDSDRGVVVLHGGDTPGFNLLTDTWEWDGTTWSRKLSPGAPPSRAGASMIYDPGRKLTLLFGGVNPITGLYSDLWAWDGKAWKQLY